MNTISKALLEGIDKVINRDKIESQNLLGLTMTNNIIGDFNPLEHNAIDWTKSVDEYAEIYNWSETVICHLALSKLRGPAEIWYRGLPSRLFTWPEWKALLIKYFEPQRDLHKSMLKMVTYVAKPEQSLYTYCFEKLTLINQMGLDINDSDKVNLIMGGIENENIKFSVEIEEINDPAKLAKHFKTIDKKIVSQKNKKNPKEGNM